jgi:hypothetical protein
MVAALAQALMSDKFKNCQGRIALQNSRVIPAAQVGFVKFSHSV